MVVQLCRLVREVELSVVSFNGEEKSVLNNAIAIKNKKGNSTFVDIAVWGKIAETIAKYFKKGDEILIKGELRNKIIEADNKNTVKVYILVRGFEFTHGNKREKGLLNTDEINIDIEQHMFFD